MFTHTHGRKSAWLRHLGALVELRTGLLHGFHRVEWSRVERLVFVCKGNICRSAYAVARARALGLEAISAGLEARAGDPANATAALVATSHGIELASHVAEPYSGVRLRSGDLVVVFEPWQARAARIAARSAGAQVTLAGFYSSPKRPHIEDPYGLSAAYFNFCFDLIDSAVEQILFKMRSWRGNRAVLVAQAETLGSLAVIRSLGRAGYEVHSCSQDPKALGFESALSAKSAVVPAYDSAEFLGWLRNYVREQKITAIVPSEGMLLAVEECFEEFAPLFPFSPERRIVYAGMSKYDLFKKFEGEANLPPTMNLDFDRADSDWRAIGLELDKMPLPLFIKLDGVYSRTGARKGAVVRVDSAPEAVQRLQDLQKEFRRAVVQGFVPGKGVGASFVVWGGHVLAGFLHLRLHEVPYTGGVSSYRRSLVHRQIRSDAESRVARLGWQGPVMMEYRWDEAADRFYLMEMNGRFWGSLHLPIQAGVDFPRILLDAFFGYPVPLHREVASVVRCRHTFPSDLQHSWSMLKDPRLSLAARVGAVCKFIWLGFDPRVGSDLLFKGDCRLYWLGISRYFRAISVRRTGGPR